MLVRGHLDVCVGVFANMSMVSGNGHPSDITFVEGTLGRLLAATNRIRCVTRRIPEFLKIATIVDSVSEMPIISIDEIHSLWRAHSTSCGQVTRSRSQLDTFHLVKESQVNIIS